MNCCNRDSFNGDSPKTLTLDGLDVKMKKIEKFLLVHPTHPHTHTKENLTHSYGVIFDISTQRKKIEVNLPISIASNKKQNKFS